MIYVMAILWVLLWGVTGYFTVRSILIHRQNKQIMSTMLHYQNLLAEADRAINHREEV